VVDLELINKRQIDINIQKMKQEALDNVGNSSDEETKENFGMGSTETKVIDPRVRYLKVDISVDE